MKKKVKQKIATGNLLLSSPLFRLIAPKCTPLSNRPISHTNKASGQRSQRSNQKPKGEIGGHHHEDKFVGNEQHQRIIKLGHSDGAEQIPKAQADLHQTKTD